MSNQNEVPTRDRPRVTIYGEDQQHIITRLQDNFEITNLTTRNQPDANNTTAQDPDAAILIYFTSARSQLSELLKVIQAIPKGCPVGVIQIFADRSNTFLEKSDFETVISVIELRYLIGRQCVPFSSDQDGLENSARLESLVEDIKRDVKRKSGQPTPSSELPTTQAVLTFFRRK